MIRPELLDTAFYPLFSSIYLSQYSPSVTNCRYSRQLPRNLLRSMFTSPVTPANSVSALIRVKIYYTANLATVYHIPIAL